MDDATTTFKPPIFSFQTFWTFLADVAAKPLPPQIDRSMLGSKSGTDQTNLLTAMKAFKLIGDDLSVPGNGTLQRFQEADEEGRLEILGELVTEYYPHQLEISDQNGTDKLLTDSFGEDFDLAGDSRRKGKTFFLHAARTAGMTLSPHFPATRSGPGSSASGPRKRRAATKTPKLPAAEETTKTQTSPTTGDSYKVALTCGGSVTLTVDVNHFDLSKNRDDRDFVNKLIDALTDYGEVIATGGPSEPQSEAGDEEVDSP